LHSNLSTRSKVTDGGSSGASSLFSLEAISGILVYQMRRRLLPAHLTHEPLLDKCLALLGALSCWQPGHVLKSLRHLRPAFFRVCGTKLAYPDPVKVACVRTLLRIHARHNAFHAAAWTRHFSKLGKCLTEGVEEASRRIGVGGAGHAREERAKRGWQSRERRGTAKD
jgi:hypothetical protein